MEYLEGVPVSKDRPERYLPGGGMELKFESTITIKGGKFSNPMIGIIGLLHEGSNDCSKLPWFVDMVFSFQGFLRAPKNSESESLWVSSYRTLHDQINHKEFLDTSDQ